MLCLDLTLKNCHPCVSCNLVAGKIMAPSMASAFPLMTSRAQSPAELRAWRAEEPLLLSGREALSRGRPRAMSLSALVCYIWLT